MMLEETTNECKGIDLSCKKTSTHREAKSWDGDDGDGDNVVLLTGTIEEKVQSRSQRPQWQVVRVSVVEQDSGQRSSMMGKP